MAPRLRRTSRPSWGSDWSRTTGVRVGPMPFATLAYQLFGAQYSPYKYAVAHWIQEIYRTRIRQHAGEPIQLLAIGQREVIASFEEVTGHFLHPISISQADNAAFLEKLLRDEQHKVRKHLLEELT